ncbi:gliding motility-associated C-terminal domain-containing protein [Pedobacter faecalis]|uniref:T9SS type B sorting domain-containing protein n=1 Tax=Pedobacter faecalis TaxID=3041495 RepID=UPI00254E0F75|nr:gliding motility-associated C-terminal domain-containing protein [Pedobacter sp. ELA7]
MKQWNIVFLILINSLFIQAVRAQNISNEGTEFWAVFPTHDPSRLGGSFSLANITVYLTSKSDSEATVTCGSFSLTQNIPANTAVPFHVPRNEAYIDSAESNQVLNNRAIRISVTPGQPKVAAYAHIYAGARSAASLILPVEALGQTYYSMNYAQANGDGLTNKNFLTLIATEDDTHLRIHLKDGSVQSVTLPTAGDVYEYLPPGQEDLTGVKVDIDPGSTNSCSKRFAAFSGSTALYIGCFSSLDPLYQQLYPTISWGKNYSIIPFKDRKYYFRILAGEDNTTVTINNTSFTLNSGQFYDASTEHTEAMLVSADKNISVAQYSLTQECSGLFGEATGDPEMVLLNPIEFNIREITLFSSNDQSILEKYINVCMKTSATASFRINGNQPAATWTVISSNPEYSYIQLNITEMSSTLSASDGFNAIAYGFGRFESYAYSAGTNLAANNYLLVNNTITGLDAKDACVGQKSNLKIVLPYLVSEISWQLDAEPEVQGQATPNAVVNSGSGIILYEYIYAIDSAFADTGIVHQVVVKAERPNQGNCLATQQIYNYSFGVNPIPLADFIASEIACENQGIAFTDLSNSLLPDQPVNKWIWDFGDGGVSTEQNPVHRYTQIGTYNYTVKLSAGLQDGCLSDVFEKTITVTINPSPMIVFDPIPGVCQEAGIVVLTQARETRGLPGSGRYSGTGVTADGRFDPRLAGPGAHTIRYTYTSNGCTETKQQTILVSPTPSLTITKTINVYEGGEKQIEATASGTDLTYKWLPAQGLSRDDILNPVVTGTDDRTYTLTITSARGCVITETVTVNVLARIEPANSFSPNGDGVNDTWILKYIETYPRVTVEVFNRYGTRIFYSAGYKAPFDGNSNKQALPAGTYYYIINPNNGRRPVTGPLTIIR